MSEVEIQTFYSHGSGILVNHTTLASEQRTNPTIKSAPVTLLNIFKILLPKQRIALPLSFCSHIVYTYLISLVMLGICWRSYLRIYLLAYRSLPPVRQRCSAVGWSGRPSRNETPAQGRVSPGRYRQTLIRLLIFKSKFMIPRHRKPAYTKNFNAFLCLSLRHKVTYQV